MADDRPGKTMLFTEQLIQEGETIVAYCPELDISSCGDTIAQARANLQAVLRLFLEEAAKMGTLRQILTEAGYDTDAQVLSENGRHKQRPLFRVVGGGVI